MVLFYKAKIDNFLNILFCIICIKSLLLIGRQTTDGLPPETGIEIVIPSNKKAGFKQESGNENVEKDEMFVHNLRRRIACWNSIIT